MSRTNLLPGPILRKVGIENAGQFNGGAHPLQP